MRRVYTDERFPGYEVVNEGAETFEVRRGGQCVGTFASQASTDEAFVARRARDYFERWAWLNEADEMRQVPPEELAAVDHTDVFNNPPRTATQQIDNLMAKLRVTTDPEQRTRLQQHIMHLMKQEESLAEAVVNQLIL